VGAGTAGGCLNRPIEPNDTRTTSTIVEPFTQSAVDKIDLVLMIDNSRSMADKQLILAAAVPDLVGALVNPKCIDPKGTTMTTQPATVTEPCPAGLVRDFKPITNIHIGIVTSSLGGHGGDACSVTNDTQSCPGSPNPSNNDAGHLVSRVDACGGALVPTYQNKGFLAWDPNKVLTPPGETTIGSINIDMAGKVTTGTPGIVPSLKDLVVGAGQVGCGYEAQLESWYRFLVDPEPYKDITLQAGKATPAGTDALLLQQRADFLRPSSLLAIIMLTDENDCSVKESGQFYYAVQQQNPQDNKKKFHLPRARKECATNPNDPCCKSCGQSVGANCPADDMCKTSPTLSDTEDDINLRCFDQKRRFGIDFLYGIDRYRDALHNRTIPNRAGEMVDNPLFLDLNPMDTDSSIRDPGLVFIAGIIGVPWEDIARDPADLTKGFKNAEELAVKDANNVSTWDMILGDPANYVPAKDPHMIESIQPRAGLPGVTSPVGTDPINGHEYTIANNDLQYACIFKLPAPRDCSMGNINGCDCTPGNDNPLCDDTTKTLQVRAKGYPGLRELATLKAAASQGIVASICPAQLNDLTKDDYGYRPAIGSIIARLKTALGGKCLARELTPDKTTSLVPCLILEASTVTGTPKCDKAKSRREVLDLNKAAIDVAKADITADKSWNQFCEIIQAGDVSGGSNQAQLDACQQDSSAAPLDKSNNPVNGWCYVDPGQSLKSNADIVKDCPATEKRLIRFVGNGNPQAGGTLFITCTGD
jgi:hypothetical protein